MKKYILLLILLFISNLPAQNENKNFTKGYENGNVWNSFYIIDSKINYLSNMLEKFHVLGEKPLIYKDSVCYNIFYKELKNSNFGKGISLNDIVNEIDVFYSNSKNLRIPILNAYCYSLRKLQRFSKFYLNNYKKNLLKIFN